MANRPPAQVPFSQLQIDQLRQMVTNAGADVDEAGDISLSASVKSKTGLWSDIYAWIGQQIVLAINHGQVSASGVSNQTYWFGAAPDINGNHTDIPSVQYIRGDTRYGLLFRNKIENIGEAAIQVGLQTTSNLIGQNVISEILLDKGVPIFPVMISGDISAAIGTGVSPVWQQTIGGWGGAFYYWNTPLNYPNKPTVTVGSATLNGNPQGTGQLQTHPFVRDACAPPKPQCRLDC